jgi:hypothetical protein
MRAVTRCAREITIMFSGSVRGAVKPITIVALKSSRTVWLRVGGSHDVPELPTRPLINRTNTDCNRLSLLLNQHFLDSLLARSPPRRWSPQSATHMTSRTSGNSLRGLGLCLDNPSTMKPWLTNRRRERSVDRSSTLPTDVNRIRTSCAVYIFARTTSNHVRPTRPCREMQSYLTARPTPHSQPPPTGPPSDHSISARSCNYGRLRRDC